MIYEKYSNIAPKVRIIVTGTQPKPLQERKPADTSQSTCYFCWQTKSEENLKYYVEQGTIVQVLDNGMIEIQIPHKVKYHPDITDLVSRVLYIDEFGSTPEQAVENKL